MKVLQLSNKIPYPEKDGGAIAINAISEGLLQAGVEVKLLAMNTKKHFIDIDSIHGKFRSERHFEAVTMDTSVKPVNALLALLSGKSYNISRFKSEKFGKKLTEILQKEKFDIIHLEGLYLAPYLSLIRQYTKAPVILRAHNVEWKIWQKLASEEKNKLKRQYLIKLAKQLKKYEEKAINLFDGIAAITNNDVNEFKQTGCKTPMLNIPFGIDISKYSPSESKSPDSLFFIGALDWLPNLQGLDWFLKNVWGNVHAEFPHVKFHVAGRKMPESLKKNTYPCVVFHGEVENAKTFIAEHNIMIVPLLAGSGVRIKIIEGMALGKPVITTGAGIDGIECVLGKDVLVENSPEGFAEAVNSCLDNGKLKKELGLNARKFVQDNYDIGKVTNRLIAFYKERILQR
jgi:glycosyltransferase involved in cell wall biosynthesis